MRRIYFPLGLLLVCLPTLPFAQHPAARPPETGLSITGAFEGWYENADGSATILVGYFNRNTSGTLDIPIGPANRVEPGGPDQGQPTHFLPGRQWGVFSIRVPKDFGTKRLTWTLTANGKTTVIPLHLDPLWLVSPFSDASGNTPPAVSFDAAAAGASGPPLSIARSLRARTGQALTLTVWVGDDANVSLGQASAPATPAVRVTWSKFRGPGEVRFAPSAPPVAREPWPGAPKSAKFAGRATTEATFSAPGEYWIEVVANDWSGHGGGGFQCCWTSAVVRVVVE